MQVVESYEGGALCAVNGELRQIDTMLVGNQPPGTWLLTFVDTAREVLAPENAKEICMALDALQQAMQGAEHDFDHLFADLADREPQLPDFLRPPPDEPTTGT